MLLLCGVIFLNTEVGYKVFLRFWDNIYIRSYLMMQSIGILFLSMIFLVDYIGSFLGSGNFLIIQIINVIVVVFNFGQPIDGPIANIIAQFILTIVIYVWVIIFVRKFFQEIERTKQRESKGRAFYSLNQSDVIYIASFNILLYWTIQHTFFLFVIYQNSLPQMVTVLYWLCLCLLIALLIINYVTIKTHNTDYILNEILKKDNFQRIFEEALKTENPVILSGEKVTREHQILIDMDIFQMINKNQMRNIRVDDRIAISIPKHILEKYVHWKAMNAEEE